MDISYHSVTIISASLSITKEYKPTLTESIPGSHCAKHFNLEVKDVKHKDIKYEHNLKLVKSLHEGKNSEKTKSTQ